MEAQSLKARGFIKDWKGIIRMHWVAKMHLESKGVYLNLILMFEEFLKGIERIGNLKWSNLGQLSIATLTWEIG